ncbi:protein of unknown function DUF610 YibQ [Desulfofarcimen acetoxidans DSM 771]|uniref:Divergent polysaccharide deacetylase family protein n=1 Tax=Desulfofarcimen acetoxidans (strain ATCC 49208 / DSM 771 / KCTC 5769 / VKM B-1644 / 5575) TaxID=485916 RepID=C8W564_DESAS|nr:divergent polysaccharide deacetylase family protein [Desulfofarcimen acetoxidans]ACV62046.1 protein of unknown function DUF610 YibQ [Desulfofarcimen acetoxidans DSM 771]
MLKQYKYKLAWISVALCLVIGIVTFLQAKYDYNSILLGNNGATFSSLWNSSDINVGMNKNDQSASKKVKKAQVAIVIDDFGQSNREGVMEMLSINRPLTFAVMPNLENSVKDAAMAKEKGFEIIVHLPMQPISGKSRWMGPGGITFDMGVEQIRQRVLQDFDQVPFAVGFNNHMGSLITSKEKLMSPILEVAKEKGFFVLDSRTTEDSKVVSISKSLGIPCAKRDVFLDEVKNYEHMKKQLKVLSTIALTKGTAIGIGHVGQGDKKMALAISEMIPVMEEQGIEFVYLSKLVH